MRSRPTVAALMILVLLVGLALGLFSAVLRERQLRAERALADAMTMAAREAGAASRARAAAAASGGLLITDERDRLAEENARLRARVRELEARMRLAEPEETTEP